MHLEGQNLRLINYLVKASFDIFIQKFCLDVIVASRRGRIVDNVPGVGAGFELRLRLGRCSTAYSNKQLVCGM